MILNIFFALDIISFLIPRYIPSYNLSYNLDYLAYNLTLETSNNADLGII